MKNKSNQKREDRIEQELSILVTDLGLMYRKYFNRRVRDIGLTSVQWQILSCITREQGITQTEIADVLYKGKASVGKTLDSLESGGWLRREPSADDRRVKKIFLTGKLDSIHGDLRGVMGDMNKVAEAGMSNKDKDRLRSGLLLLLTNLGSTEK